MMSGMNEMDRFLGDMRAYLLRQAEWLALEPTEVFELSEAPAAGQGSPLAPWLKVSWRSVAEQRPLHGHLVDVVISKTGDEPAIFHAAVMLDDRDVEQMRAVIGEKPVPPWEKAGQR